MPGSWDQEFLASRERTSPESLLPVAEHCITGSLAFLDALLASPLNSKAGHQFEHSLNDSRASFKNSNLAASWDPWIAAAASLKGKRLSSVVRSAERSRVSPLSLALHEGVLAILRFMGKPPETTRFAYRWRKHATCGFANGLQATRFDPLMIAAGVCKTTPPFHNSSRLEGSVYSAEPFSSP